MSSDTPRSQAADGELLELVAALQAESRGPHPPPGDLLAYRRGELPAGEAGALQDHLADCRACSGVLVDLDALEGTGPAAGADEPEEAQEAAGTGDDGEAAWRALAARLPEDGGEHEVLPFRGRPRSAAPPSAAGPARRSRVPAWAPWLAAAAMLVLSVGLGVEVARLRGAAAPQANVPLVYLDAATRSETADGAGDAVPVPAAGGGGVVVLVVTPEEPGAYVSYALELESGEGTWTVTGLEPTEPYGTLRAAVPAEVLEAGPASVRLLGGAERRVLATYRLEPAPR